MGNSNSTEKTHPDRNAANASESSLGSASGYQIDKTSPAPPVVTTPSHNDTAGPSRTPFRLSVTSYNDSDRPPDSASSDISATDTGGSPVDTAAPNDDDDDDGVNASTAVVAPTAAASASAGFTGSSAAATSTTATHAPRAVPLSTGRSGWVSSTGNTSPWYGGSLSSSTSSHHRSDSVRGPYYRARAMSVNRESEVDEDASTPQRISRNPSISQQQQSRTGVPTIITWSQGGHNVYVTGTFNGWKHKIKLIKSTQDFTAVLELPPGTHRLKFIVDDEWKCSNEMETATDPDGNLVNYLQVLDEYEDSLDEFGESRDDQDATPTSRSSTPTEEYTSEIPPDLMALASSAPQDDARAATEWEHRQPQPPCLPPHLEKVLLNSQAISDQDNSVLPEPNHVTLNHLYASSIKDNVMALSTTTRYRKKYVTTMYYRPVFPRS